MRFLIGLLCFIILAGVPRTPVSAQSGYPCALEYTRRNGQLTYFHRYLRVTFNQDAGTINLFDAQTRDIVHELESDVAGFQFQLVGWSASCRYIAGQLGVQHGYELYIWDAETGQRVQRVAGVMRMFGSSSTIHWSPDETRAVIEGAGDAALVQLDTGAVFRFESQPLSYGSFVRWVWDMPNQRFYAILRRGQVRTQRWDRIIAVNLNDGRIVATYSYTDPGERIVLGDLFLSTDHNYLVAYSTYNEYWMGAEQTPTTCNAGFAIWNVWTGDGQIVQTGCNPLPRPTNGRRRVALSPDNRYLVAGRDRVRVWDLTAIHADASPNWSFAGPDYRVGHIRFADGQTLETFALNERRYALRWNLFTGDYVNAFDYDLNVEVNRDGSPLQ